MHWPAEVMVMTLFTHLGRPSGRCGCRREASCQCLGTHDPRHQPFEAAGPAAAHINSGCSGQHVVGQLCIHYRLHVSACNTPAACAPACLPACTHTHTRALTATVLHVLWAHLFHVKHAIDLWRDTGSQAVKQTALPAQLLNCGHILIGHLAVAAGCMLLMWQ